MTSAEITLTLLALCNSARVFSYRETQAELGRTR
jgi:hypothetical protein